MSMMPGIAPPHPIPIKDRASILFIEKGRLDVLDGAFVVVDKNGVRTHIPVGGIACLMLEPGTRVSHAAVALAARVGCLLVWVGEAGVRLYSAGQPGGCARRPLAPPGALGSGTGMHDSRSFARCTTCDSANPRRNDARSISCAVSKAHG